MEEYLRFKKLLTPLIIKVVYWVTTLLVIIGGIGVLFTSDGDPGSIIGGLLLLIFGPLAVRFYVEIILIGFLSYEALIRIDNNTRTTGNVSQATIYCGSCGASNPLGSKYCGSCSAGLDN